ncbi:MAG TPA: diaminopimelate epimerase [Pseudomonadales bacterium]
MKLEFAKMHGLGNDFMVLDLISQDFEPNREQIHAWADRRTGIGFDQMLTISAPTDPDADFRYRIYNADGTEVEQCGNGARCAARFIAERKLSPKDTLVLETLAGPISTALLDAETVEVDLGVPSTRAEDVPFSPEAACGAQGDAVGTFTLRAGEGEHEVTPVSVGNPHGVLFVTQITDAPVDAVGASLTRHPFFPEGANIGFCQVVDPHFIRLRVYERGVGETRACGTGACAAVVAGQLLGHLEDRVKVSLPGGKVRIAWQGPETTVRMAGPATLVYEGHMSL